MSARALSAARLGTHRQSRGDLTSSVQLPPAQLHPPKRRVLLQAPPGSTKHCASFRFLPPSFLHPAYTTKQKKNFSPDLQHTGAGLAVASKWSREKRIKKRKENSIAYLRFLVTWQNLINMVCAFYALQIGPEILPPFKRKVCAYGVFLSYLNIIITIIVVVAYY